MKKKLNKIFERELTSICRLNKKGLDELDRAIWKVLMKYSCCINYPRYLIRIDYIKNEGSAVMPQSHQTHRDCELGG